MKSVGISNNADPDKWYESVNPILDTDPISLIADFIPTMKRMLILIGSDRGRYSYGF